jgi:FMN-dependent oxidoreductase (nitrilotriacetate monooxygenase family)
MTDQRRQMKLGLNIVGNGAHAAGWRLPEARADAAMDFPTWRDIAQQAERAAIHFMFWADGAAVRHNAKDDEQLSYLGRIDVWEPFTIMAALAAVTQHLGFIASASTTYNDPYTIARKFASLDHISGGRVGWNVVTSWSEQEALNYGREQHMEHGLRYRRAEEFVDVVMGLWDSWEDDAFIRDKATGQYFDPAKLHNLNHRGETFAVHGPLNVSRPIQGYPVIAQAGSSGPGQNLGGRIADIIYTAQKDKEEAKSFYRSVKQHAAANGRDPAAQYVMPGILPVLGSTQAEAQHLMDRLQDLIHPQLGLSILASSFGDLSGYDLDGPVPDALAEHNGVKSGHEQLMRMVREKRMTIRELYKMLAGASGHLVMVGTPETVADRIEDWFTDRACDGFNLIPPYMPGGSDAVLMQLVPELQRRGLAQREYTGTTLRETMGLPRPAHGSHRPRAALRGAAE